MIDKVIPSWENGVIVMSDTEITSEVNPVSTETKSNVVCQVSQEDLQTLLESRETAIKADQEKTKTAADAKTAELVAENAELKFRIALNGVYLKYSLKPEYVLSLNDGVVRLAPIPVEGKKE
jgi:hypothetical protein